MLTCELQRLDDNELLWSDWRNLLTRTRPEHRLFGPEWFSIWGQTVGSSAPWTGAMHVVAVREHSTGQLVGVFPFGEPKIGVLRVNALAGYFQPWRTIVADQSCEFAVGRSIGWFLVELGWSIMQLGPWPMALDAHQGVLSALEELDMPIKRQQSDFLAIADNLPPTWPEYEMQIVGLKYLRRLRNYENKLKKEHSVELVHHQTVNESDIKELFTDLANVERRSWLVSDPHGRPRFIEPIDQRFWNRLANEFLVPNEFLDCWVLRANGKPISFVFALTVHGTRYVIANNYDQEWAQFRPGSILFRHMFQEGYSRGVTRYDFGTNELHYRQHWGARYADHVESFAVPINRMVASFWNVGVKLKGLFDSTLWGEKTEPAQELSTPRSASFQLATQDASNVDNRAMQEV